MQPWFHAHAHLLRGPREAAAVLAATGAAVALGGWVLLRKRPSAQELEARRRAYLAAHGRVTDGALIDATPDLTEPRVIVYRYRIAGVTYECSQDVSPFAATLHLPALDLPIQVRYRRANPGDSIVVAEGWNGLWSVPAELPRMEDR